MAMASATPPQHPALFPGKSLAGGCCDGAGGVPTAWSASSQALAVAHLPEFGIGEHLFHRTQANVLALQVFAPRHIEGKGQHLIRPRPMAGRLLPGAVVGEVGDSHGHPG